VWLEGDASHAECSGWCDRHGRNGRGGRRPGPGDHGPSTHFGSHVVLCGGGVPIFENVAALDAVPDQGAFVIALPMKIAGGSGGPLRIVARLPATDD
jgi:kynurenine formamidase